MRPSEVYFIGNEIAAYCFDRAVHFFGSQVEREMEMAANPPDRKQLEAAAKAQAVLEKYFKMEDVGKYIGHGRFRDPAKSMSL